MSAIMEQPVAIMEFFQPKDEDGKPVRRDEGWDKIDPSQGWGSQYSDSMDSHRLAYYAATVSHEAGEKVRDRPPPHWKQRLMSLIALCMQHNRPVLPATSI